MNISLLNIIFQPKRIIVIIIVNLFIYYYISSPVYSQDEDYKIKTVVIDAGHGGKDPGTVGEKAYEKNIALAIALKSGHYIDSLIEDVKVIYTRTTDTFVELHKRAKIANSNNADLFISIHVNGSSKASAVGTSTHVLGLHRTNEQLEVAQKENSVILMEDDYSTIYEKFDPNSPESYIIFSLIQNIYLDQSLEFAAKVQDEFRERADRVDRGVRQNGFLVLARSTMPGVLIETGFLTNPEEEEYLMSDTGQVYIASAIFRAFRDYKDHIESKTVNDSIIKDTVQENIILTDSNGIIFKVQVSSSKYRVQLDKKKFKGLGNIEELRIDGTYKYTTGHTGNFDEIKKIQKKVKKKFPDAFIISFKDGKKIPINEALKEIKN